MASEIAEAPPTPPPWQRIVARWWPALAGIAAAVVVWMVLSSNPMQVNVGSRVSHAGTISGSPRARAITYVELQTTKTVNLPTVTLTVFRDGSVAVFTRSYTNSYDVTLLWAPVLLMTPGTYEAVWSDPSSGTLATGTFTVAP